jgi:purine-binding chemotaxis protein CheW
MTSSDPKPDFDWDALRARLARASDALDETLVPSREQIHRRLEERARMVATSISEEALQSDVIELLAFSSSGERYAIETRYVHSVAPLAGVTMIPGVSRVFSGLANLRGEIVPVIRLSELLGSAARVAASVPWMLVLGEGQPDIGIAIGQEVETRTLAPSEIISSDSAEDVAKTPLQRGVTKDALIILNGAALLADPRLQLDHSSERMELSSARGKGGME